MFKRKLLLLTSQGDKIMSIRMGRSCTQNGIRCFQKFKTLDKRTLGRLKRRWEDDIRIDIKEIGIIDSAQDRGYWRVLVHAALNFLVP